MNEDFDKLIRNAKPAVPEGARARVLEHVEAHGAVASAPAPWRVLLRAAALVLLAVFAGVAAALAGRPEPAPAGDPVAELAAEVKALDAQVAALERDSAALQLAKLQAEVAALETRRQAFEQAVTGLVEAHELCEREEWRQRHIEHMRRHYAEEQEATIERLRSELNLSAEQEKEVRALLTEAGKQAEGLIGEVYTSGRRRHDPRMHDKFAQLASETETQLNALLNEQQRGRMAGPTGIVSSEPEDWAPRSDFRDATDLDVWTNWINVTRE
ncbi:MAG: hypothetical protein H6840_11140 [Planctomycetes bacterium]|nr:hypothetical protein [Planctomycetota bacterium]